ncbi:MAG: arsenate reductase ArsC [Alphaproteobacteria bacterium]
MTTTVRWSRHKERHERELNMGRKIYNVLFLCPGNSTCSIMAESLLSYWGRGRFQAFSAGLRPDGWVSSKAVRVLEAFDLPVDGLRSKSWREFIEPGAPIMDFVFNVCKRMRCAPPAWPGRPVTSGWPFLDPAAMDGSELERLEWHVRVLMALEYRVRAFVEQPLESLDQPHLQKTLDAIASRHGELCHQLHLH